MRARRGPTEGFGQAVERPLRRGRRTLRHRLEPAVPARWGWPVGVAAAGLAWYAADSLRHRREGGHGYTLRGELDPASEDFMRAAEAVTGAPIDVDLFELNEAFAAVGLASMADLGITDEVTNVNGGAISLGHPIGMSGTRLALTLLHELKRRGGGTGAAALCGGGGQGDALLLKTI